jgi:hypothetical protein
MWSTGAHVCSLLDFAAASKRSAVDFKVVADNFHVLEEFENIAG